MVLYFIRHAESENNALWARTGSSVGRSDDPDLSERGYQQAGILGAHIAGGVERYPYDAPDGALSGYRISHLYASPMIRALETAGCIASETGVALRCRADMHETGGVFLDDVDQGVRRGLEGNTRDDLERRFPDADLSELPGTGGWWGRPFEELAGAYVRARSVLSFLLDNHGDSDDRVAVITHGAFYRCMITTLLQVPEHVDLWISLCNGGITRLDFKEEETAIAYCNDVSHIPPDTLS